MQPPYKDWIKAHSRIGPKPNGAYRIPHMSKRRKKVEPAYTAAKRMHLKEFPFCQIGPRIRAAGLKVRCTGRAYTVHHVKGRLGPLLCDRKHFLSCCDGECHPEFIHYTHKAEAIELGLLILK